MMNTLHIDLVVRCTGNSYQAAARGKRASATAGPETCVLRLADKLFDGAPHQAVPLPAQAGDDHNVTRWRLQPHAQEAC